MILPNLVTRILSSELALDHKMLYFDECALQHFSLE